jgi:predicted MFS family arabinose efflux permease
LLLRTTRAELTGSIREVLPVAYLLAPEELFSAAGGIAAAIAIGGFVGQAASIARSLSEDRRRRETAVMAFAGLLVMIGLILLSANGR